jgi:serine O-acetyltransferase
MLDSRFLWLLSCRLYRSGHPRLARGLKAVNHFVWHCVLPYQADVAPDVRLGHHGLGVAIHPHTTIGRRVTIWQGVTISAQPRDENRRVVIGDDVMIGANAVLLAPPGVLRIGSGARIGAGAVVTKNVPPGATVVGPAARVINGEDRPARAV